MIDLLNTELFQFVGIIAIVFLVVMACVIAIIGTIRDEQHFKDAINILESQKMEYTRFDLLTVRMALEKLGIRDTIKILSGSYTTPKE